MSSLSLIPSRATKRSTNLAGVAQLAAAREPRAILCPDVLVVPNGTPKAREHQDWLRQRLVSTPQFCSELFDAGMTVVAVQSASPNSKRATAHGGKGGRNRRVDEHVTKEWQVAENVGSAVEGQGKQTCTEGSAQQLRHSIGPCLKGKHAEAPEKL
ncbi:unnamed protein product [Symbiodinium natans]|uniref:Uncharacterized protein n=1 Tax=Symbiodinium natans TaxID=878477 RepID=A0A812UBP6_9DINO|nr:unnamed protein product [Symbiodinium natans]